MRYMSSTSDVMGSEQVHCTMDKSFGRFSLLNRLAQTIFRWHCLARERRALSRLNDRMLKDVGLTRADVEQESRRCFWDESR